MHLTEEKIYLGASEIIKAIDDHFETAGKIYNFNLIKDLRFKEGVFYEDGGYSIRAINACNSMVTVPDTTYHYVSNPKSTIKQKLKIKNENDKIYTSLDLIDYAKENNIQIKERPIFKEDYILWAIKHYTDRKDFYFCGLKLYSKKEPFTREKIFAIFNTAWLGDVLLCGPLCQSIKQCFPYSKVIFITDKNFSIMAKYISGVDEVIAYDKKGENKGVLGFIKFIIRFKYKNIFSSVITYKNEKNYIIAKLIRSRFIFMGKGNRKDKESIQFSHIKLIQNLTNKNLIDIPMKYNLPEGIKNIINEKNYIVICTISKRKDKDMPVETAAKLINTIENQTDLKVVFVGIGNTAKEYTKELDKIGCRYINLVDKTSLLELGAVLKKSKGLISVDTGTLHYACSLNVPSVAVFYEKDNVPIWAPNPKLYKTITIEENQTFKEIFNNLINLIYPEQKQ